MSSLFSQNHDRRITGRSIFSVSREASAYAALIKERGKEVFSNYNNLVKRQLYLRWTCVIEK
jgi:hypothetical protein